MHSLTTIDEWNELKLHSYKESVLIYKHSTICGVCTVINDRLIHALEEGAFSSRVYRVTVQDNRDVSDRISQDLQVKHETPQLIVIKDGKPVCDFSHYDIVVEEVKACLS